MTLWLHILRALMITALVVGILLPRMSAVLAEMSPNVWVIVICTGTTMETIILGPDGEPVANEEAMTDPCVGVPKSQLSAFALGVFHQLLRDHDHAFSIQERAHAALDLTSHPPIPRGPPRPV